METQTCFCRHTRSHVHTHTCARTHVHARAHSGVPAWIGNGSYFSDDNVAYQTQWVQCMKDAYVK